MKITKYAHSNAPKNARSGFTLIEIIAVLALLGILAAVAIPRYVDLTDAAEARAIDAAIAELNGREALTWANEMLSNSGTATDAAIFTALSTDLGADYVWTVAATAAGGTLSFQGGTGVALTRTAAADTNLSPAVWTQ